MKKEPTLPQRQALEMRAKIQSAALTLFNREGFENVSVEEIAQMVGCSVGNIYHYFKSKDELAIRVTQIKCTKMLEIPVKSCYNLVQYNKKERTESVRRYFVWKFC